MHYTLEWRKIWVTIIYLLYEIATCLSSLNLGGVIVANNTPYVGFFRFTQYNADAHNTHAHSPL
jgi:hypothetical protein